MEIKLPDSLDDFDPEFLNIFSQLSMHTVLIAKMLHMPREELFLHIEEMYNDVEATYETIKRSSRFQK